MKRFLIVPFALVAAFGASTACAQYGLYGAPEVLPAPQTSVTPGKAALASYADDNGAPMLMPAGSTSSPAAVQPTPAPSTYNPPPPAYSPPPAKYPPASNSPPAYRYPAERPSTAMYQPYQAGAQYRYPAPAGVAPASVPATNMAFSDTANLQYPTTDAMAGAPTPTPARQAPIPTPASPSPDRRPPPQQWGMPSRTPAGQNSYVPTPADRGCGGCGDGWGVSGLYRGAPERGGCGAAAEGCGCEGLHECDGCCRWYGSITALVMNRSDAHRVWTSYATDDETNQLTNSDFGTRSGWGGEARFGRRFCWNCVPFAVEASYWTTEDLTGYRSTTNPGGVSTPLVIQPMLFGGSSAENWFDGAAEHRLWRRDEFHDVEINLLREQLALCCNSPWDLGWSVGIRYFRFQEGLTFGSLAGGHTWGESDGLYEAYLDDQISNNLVGVQCGFDAAYNVCGGLRFFVSPKVGIYGNYLDQTFGAHTGNGINGTGPYGSFPVHSTRGGVSFLTQVDVGADWQFAHNWSLRAGYRVVAATGIGTADENIPQYMVDIPNIADIQHTGNLVLHGAFVGVTYCF